jgi:hypothetical protein
MKKVNEYNIASMLIVPFRCGLEQNKFNSKFKNEDFVTQIEIKYHDTLDIKEIPGLSLQTKLCTFIEIQTKLLLGLEKETAKKWIKENHLKIIESNILPKINHFFYHIKYQKPDLLSTGVIRAIGPIDLLFVNLIFDGEVIYSRVISTFISAIKPIPKVKVAGPLEPFLVRVDLSEELPKEWLILTRARDLVNHGYYIESLIIGYSLLEECTKKFFLENIPNLNADEAEKFLQMIEKRRLEAYLGCITKLCFGRSLLGDKTFKTDLKWLVKKRNGIIHEGNDCNLEDAKRGLKIVHTILGKLNEYDMIFKIPADLEFW